MEQNKKIRWGVFLIPWLLSLAAIVLNFISGEMFNSTIMSITNFILEDCSWLFTVMSFVCVVLVVVAYFTPFGNVRMGGRKARPMLKQANYVQYH